MKQVLKNKFLFALASLFAIPFVASAAVVSTPSILTDLVETFTNWGMAIAGSLALLFIIVAGINFIWNGGDESKLKTARNMIIYAAVGLAIVMLAKTIQAIVITLAGVGK
jgi:hypothetical protein